MRRLADAHELTVVLITHKLREVMQFAQDVTILRGGRVVAQTNVAAFSEAGLATLMFGEALSLEKMGSATKELSRHARAYLEVDGLHVIGDRGTPAILDVGFKVHAGEIVGMAGISGNGQKELIEVLAGQRDAQRGNVRVDGQPFGRTRRELERKGVSLLTEEPLANAAVRSMTVTENLALRQFDRAPLAIGGVVLKRRALRPFARRLIARYGIRASSPSARLETLSGGNVQRTVLARELSRDVRLLIMQNPCFGLDAAAAAEIRRQILRARDGGAAVLLVSEDLDEVLELSDRVLVIASGRITYETARANADRYEIGRHMTQGPARQSA